jgi:DNA-binding MarR family transcriptional regulator
MNGLELFLLGRKLMKLGEEAIPPSGFRQLPTSVRSVLIDVYEHPGSSISEITERTGFPHSHVSMSVARLRKASALITTSDPADRRRTLVAPNPEVLRRLPELASEPVDVVLTQATESSDVAEAVELLARRLAPKAPKAPELQSGRHRPVLDDRYIT